MTISPPAPASPVLTRRDRALLTTVATGRCRLSDAPAPHLLIDGRCVCDQHAAYRLVALGLIASAPGSRNQPPSARRPKPATLTSAGRAALSREGDRDPAER